MGITVKDLSADQLSAYNDIVNWMRDLEEEPGVLTLGGYAGTGKSTLVSLVAEQCQLPAFCAYTGKATSVLRRKLAAAGTETVGAQKKTRDGEMSREERPYCGTIHSLIYQPCQCREPKQVAVSKPCAEKGCAGEVAWIDGNAVCANKHANKLSLKAFESLKPKTVLVRDGLKNEDGSCKFCGDKGWLRREALDRNYGLIIVDEASMVDDMMLRDLKAYGVPILAVGDHGQLPPVGGSGSLMKNPNLRLERIHRQAEGNPIIALSKMIRETGRLPDTLPGDDVVFERLRFVDQLIEKRYADASPERLLAMGLACYTNRRRMGLNVAARRAIGVARNGRELPRRGEHVICLRNMKGEQGRPPVSNGMRGVLQTDATPKQEVNYRGEKLGASEVKLVGSIAFPEDEIDPVQYEMLRAQFGREKTFGTPEELVKETGIHSFAMAGALFDYGYAMTVHKMQGSQFDDLVVCAERPGPVGDEDWRRWLYTAVTRAAKKLTVLR